MKKIPFVKFTSYGNNFVIVDEVSAPVLSEPEKQDFAYRATDTCFGVGSDNLLVIQNCREDVLASINRTHQYWSELPHPASADFIFRMFEPDGSEALCCGNGLMSIASYLSEQYGIMQTRIMTELPLAEPNVLTIGANPKTQMHWSNMGWPRELPDGLIDIESASVKPCDDPASVRIEALPIEFRSHDLSPFSDSQQLSLNGYAVFTGEPHLVVLVDDGFSLPELGDALFVSPTAQPGQTEKRSGFGTWLIDHVGHYVNKRHRDLFPAGISVNFVRVDRERGEVMYRCFERGINHETLACGTGALAVAYVVRQLGLSASDSVVVRPSRCNWFQPDAKIIVEQSALGWALNGRPMKLLEGVFAYASSVEQAPVAVPAAPEPDSQTTAKPEPATPELIAPEPAAQQVA